MSGINLEDMFREVLLEAMVIFCFRNIMIMFERDKEKANAAIRDFITSAAVETEKKMGGLVDAESIRIAKEKFIRTIQI